jgi:hypothetical protein
MSWFSTSKFHFELPGNRWEERTLQIFRPMDDDRSVFIVGRAKLPSEGRPDVESLLASLPEGPYDERKIIRHERCQVGPLEGEDVSVFARAGAAGDYYRFVSVPYYDLELTFQFAGPMSDRAQVDARVDATLSSVWFRRR